MSRELTPCEKAEQSVQKKFRATIWTLFVKGIKQYKLINPGDKIAVCISGGKDSMLLAKLMQSLRRFSDFAFELEFLVMDPGYNPENRQKIISNAELLQIPITLFESKIFDVVAATDRSPCYLCARMRRGYLYSKAKELGCNKIALGHHFSDAVETTLLGLLYGAQFQTMMPKLKSKNFEGMELIRPLYLVHEESIISWKNYNKLEFIQCACRFTEECEKSGDGMGESKRLEVKKLLKELRRTNREVEHRIFKSTHMVNLETVMGYKKEGVEHSFLDDYDNKTNQTDTDD